MAGMSLPTPTLQTERLRLRPFTDTDADPLLALHSSAHVLRYWDSPPWTEPERARRFIATCRQMADEGTGTRVAVDRLSDGRFIGWCAIVRWNPDHRSASMGYCYDDAAWGQGYATEAARALLTWAFETLDLNRVQAETDTRNLASARVLEKVGFVREGTLREDCVVNGEVSDSWVFGLIRREWQPGSPVVTLATFPDPAPLHTGRLTLEPLRVEHAAETTVLLDDPELHTFIGGSPPTEEELVERYRHQTTGWSPDRSQRWLNWVVRRQDDDRVVGTVQATVTSFDGGLAAEVAWVVGAGYQGRGYAKEAAATMVTWLRSRGVSRVVAHVHPDHRASQAVARVVGLSSTGTRRDGEEEWRG